MDRQAGIKRVGLKAIRYEMETHTLTHTKFYSISNKSLGDMNISDVRIVLSPSSSGVVLGYVTVVFDDCFLVRNLRILRRDDYFILAMPSREASVTCECGFSGATGRYCCKCGAKLPEEKLKSVQAMGNGRYQDLAHPINAEFRESLEAAVFQKYRAMTQGRKATA